MVAIVVVSHSRALAEAAVALALQMAPGEPPPIEIAAGVEGGAMGTDAARVKDAIDRVASPAGVLVLMDLGSAVLSAEMALELGAGTGPGPPIGPVVLSAAPLVEGLVSAVALAAAGAPIQEVASEAERAALAKRAQLGTSDEAVRWGPAADGPALPAVRLTVRNPNGLHARPAARFVATARGFDAGVSVRDLTAGQGPVSGRSLSALMSLGAQAGHELEVSASGPQAVEALAALQALAGRNFDDGVAGTALTPPPPASPGLAAPAPDAMKPRPASPGIGTGPKTSLTPTAPPNAGGLAPPGPSGQERERLLAAVEAVRLDLAATRESVKRRVGQAEAGILEAQAMLLDDEELTGRALGLIATEAMSAEQAWGKVVGDLEARMASLPAAYLRARAGDFHAVGAQVLGRLAGTPVMAPGSATGIVVAAELTPAQVGALDPRRAVGIVMAAGSPLSHAAILARSLGIPAVVGAGEGVLGVPDGTPILVDGSAGVVIVDPSPSLVAQYGRRAAGQSQHARRLLQTASGPVFTTDGVPVEVCANIGSRREAVEAVTCGADGVGVLRTEFLFLDRPGAPTEDEQLDAYLDIAQVLEGRRLTIRTLDIGGDKPVPYLPPGAGTNPFLGRRGLRLSLAHPGLFRPQLRAIVRTATSVPVTVLFPMVTTVEELREARAMLDEAAVEVGFSAGSLPAGLLVGAMAEVPAFALRGGAALSMLDVISIGSNDLSQYTLAAERGNAEVAWLADDLDPAVLKLIAALGLSAGGKTRVAVCGELAGDPAAAGLLVGLGVRELSMAAGAIPEVKHALRSVSGKGSAELAQRALQCGSAAEVRDLLRPKRRRSQKGLAGPNR